jgi:hypothetical protein
MQTHEDTATMHATLEQVKNLRDGDAEIVLLKQKKKPHNKCNQQHNNHADNENKDQDTKPGLKDACDTWYTSRFIPVCDSITGEAAILVVENDVSQLEHTQVTVQALQEAQLAQEHLFSTVCDELHAPLNGITGLSELIVEDENAHEHVKEAARIILSSGMLLNSIVNDILDAASMRCGKLGINLEPVDVSEIVLQVFIAFIMYIYVRLFVYTEREVYSPTQSQVQQYALNLSKTQAKYENTHKYIRARTGPWHHLNDKRAKCNHITRKVASTHPLTHAHIHIRTPRV